MHIMDTVIYLEKKRPVSGIVRETVFQQRKTGVRMDLPSQKERHDNIKETMAAATTTASRNESVQDSNQEANPKALLYNNDKSKRDRKQHETQNK